MILNDLPWKWTEIILSFLRLHPSTAFWTLFVDYDDYSISSQEFLPTTNGEIGKLSLKYSSCSHNEISLLLWKCKLFSCLTLWDPMDYTVHGILQARILEWVAFPFSRRSSQPRDQTQVSHIAGGFFTSWTTREALPSFCLLLNCQFLICSWCFSNQISPWKPSNSTAHFPDNQTAMQRENIICVLNIHPLNLFD